MHQNDINEVSKILNKGNYGKGSVLDIGSMDVNGTVKPLFQGYESYTGVDLSPGKNVDIVIDSPYSFPFENESFDIIVSLNCLEHSENPFKVVEEMHRVLKKDGYIILIVPFIIHEHRYPVDCFRILPDGMRAIFKHINTTTIDAYIFHVAGPTHSTVGIGKKNM